MLHTDSVQSSVRTAVVSKVASGQPAYLRLEPNGGTTWVADPANATAFDSMREASRMALRLPSGERAFSLPTEG